MAPRLKQRDLGPLDRLASGGQGIVHAARNLRTPHAASVVYKEYKATVLPDLRVAALDAMPDYLESLPFSSGMELLNHAAWPCRLVEENNSTQVTGFVMPSIPADFALDMTLGTQIVTVSSEFQHLLNTEDFLARRGIALTDRDRYKLLSEVVDSLMILHRNGIAVGDLSPKNLLFALQPAHRAYFIDCDAMRLRGRSALDQVETPGWDVHAVHPGEELATTQSDAYKLGLLVLRLFAGNQITRDPNALPAQVPDPIRQLVIAAVTSAPGRRPEPARWVQPLGQAAIHAATQLPQRTAPPRASSSSGQPAPARSPFGGPRPGVPTQPGAGGPIRPSALAHPPRFSKGVKAFAAIALVVVIGVFLGNRGGGKPAPAAGSHVSAGTGTATVLATVSVGTQPWAVATDPTVGKVFVTNSVSNTVSVLDSASGALTATLTGFAKPTALVVDSTAQMAYVTNAAGNSVTLVDTRRGTVLASIPVGAAPYGIAADPSANTLYISNFDADTVSVVDTRARAVVATIPVGSHPYGVAFDASTHSVYVTDAGPPGAVERTVTVIDSTRAVVSDTISVGNQPWGVAIDSTTSTAYVTNHQDGTVSVIDTRTRTVTSTVRTGLGPVGVAVDSGAHTAYITNHGLDNARTDSTLTALDTRIGKVGDSVRVGLRPHGIAVDPQSGRIYVTNFTDGTVSLIGR